MKFFGLCMIALLAAGASATVENYSYSSYGSSSVQAATKGGAVQATKGGAAKAGMKSFIRPQPTLSKTRYPTKGLQPQYEQKIEQQVIQQQEELPQQQVVQQIEEQVVQKVEQVPEASTKQVKKVGVTKWEQKIEQVPMVQRKKTNNNYVPRKNLKPIVQKIEQQIQQQEEEPFVQQVIQQQEEEPMVQQKVEQKVEQKVLAQRPVYSQTRRVLKPQKKIEENVRQVPQSFDGNWE